MNKKEEKIAFCCPWGINSAKLLYNFKLLTPNNDGVWENLVGVDDVYDADWIIASENIDPAIDMRKINQDNIILFEREPPWIGTPNWNNHSTEYKFRFSSGRCFRVCGWSWNSTYKDMREYKWKKRDKKICVITSNKRMCQGHLHRLNFIKYFCNRYPGILDVYGVGMENEGLGDNFKGTSVFGDSKKFEWLQQYEYSLTLENGQGNGFFTEKLVDAFMAYTVPIYWGAPDINKYFLPNSLYTLDITNPQSPERLLDIISNPVTSSVIESMQDSRARIMTKYNWWPTIKKIIDASDKRVK
tara:strand:- start:5308 stop:6207 length:900 start_codon:yes stop_codon:yes gene_type:complete